MTRANETIGIDRDRAALIIQDMQNDAISEGGAFADSGAPRHAAEQNVVENCRRLADACRKAGVPVIHIWHVVEDGAKGLKLNAPLFEGVHESRALVRGSWGAEPVPGLERQPGDLLVEKMRMSGWQDTILESLLRDLDRDQVIVTGAWTNMSIEHTARSGADKGYFMFVPEDCCSTTNADWHNASINYALQNVSIVTNCAAVIAAIAG
jgi:gluconolactonase